MRIGILSTAQITERSLLLPAANIEGVEIACVASRNRDRAQAYAAAHGIGRAYGDYQDLLDDASLDAVYIPLPPSIHAQWSIAALESGHHVLCEKPFAANADQAKSMVDAADRSGNLLVEAFHWRYHPFAGRAVELTELIGPIVRGTGVFKVALDSSKIGYRFDLAGGAMMGVGCYPVHWLRSLLREEPNVESARGIEGPTGIDLSMEAWMHFPSGAECSLSVSMAPNNPSEPDSAFVHLEGRAGELRLEMSPTSRRVEHRILAKLPDGQEIEEGGLGGTSTYVYQLEAFVDMLAGRRAPLTGGEDAIANMTAIDSIYRAAGFPPRQ